jgi:hypothetical protein
MMRENVSRARVAALSVILLLACLNEIVAAFLIIIPVLDAIVRQGWEFHRNWWIAGHALVPPLALTFLEWVVNGHLVAPGTDPEGASHLSMLVYYMSENEHGLAELYAFVLNWFFFNGAAPTPDPSHYVASLRSAGYFEPALTNYLSSPISCALIALLGLMLATGLLPRSDRENVAATAGVLWGLLGYTVLRGAFFFVFDPGEALLYASPVTLAHLLIIALLFTGSNFPRKGAVVVVVAALLVATNARFFIA